MTIEDNSLKIDIKSVLDLNYSDELVAHSCKREDNCAINFNTNPYLM